MYKYPILHYQSKFTLKSTRTSRDIMLSYPVQLRCLRVRVKPQARNHRPLATVGILRTSTHLLRFYMMGFGALRTRSRLYTGVYLLPARQYIIAPVPLLPTPFHISSCMLPSLPPVLRVSPMSPNGVRRRRRVWHFFKYSPFWDIGGHRPLQFAHPHCLPHVPHLNGPISPSAR